MTKRRCVAIVDDYGERIFTISSEHDGIYNFYQRDLEGNKLRYNEREGRIEYYDSEKERWDVYCAYIYGANFM